MILAGRLRARRGAALASIGIMMILTAGCSLAPKSFKAISNPAPFTRARAVGLSDKARADVAIPGLIGRLNDSDSVVRLAAHEELKKRTNQDFGYEPWEEGPERKAAVDRWSAWWQSRTSQAGGTPVRQASRRMSRRTL